MKFRAKHARIVLLLFSAIPLPGLAQEQENRANTNGAERITRKYPDQQQKQAASQLLTSNEGLAILGAALDSRHHRVELSADCSHFVHELYERAGFPFEYASSSDLYQGTSQFRRVASPQPGDLAVWRGHAGIVINPAQHSFFSVLHSGPGVDLYDSSYWKRRGQPRFFRYVKQAPGGVLNSAIRTASWQPTSPNNADPDEPTAEDIPSTNLAASSVGAIASPQTLIVNSVRPTPAQVEETFRQSCTDSEATLRGHDLFKFSQSLIVFGHFSVKKVHTSGNQGWAEVQIDELASLTGGNVELHGRSEQQRWSLTRNNNKSWKLTPSPSAIYVPPQAAQHILIRELAQLSENTPNNPVKTQQMAELAQLLDVLFEK
jgi:hypothetical protein